MLKVISKIPFDYEVVSLEYLKMFLKVTTNEENKLIISMFNAALDYAEKYCSMEIKRKEIHSIIHNNKSRERLISPLIEVLEIKEVETENIIEESNYKISGDEVIFKNIINQELSLTYMSGFNEIPAILLQGVLRHTALLFDREIVSGDNLDSIHLLYKGYKKIRI